VRTGAGGGAAAAGFLHPAAVSAPHVLGDRSTRTRQACRPRVTARGAAAAPRVEPQTGADARRWPRARRQSPPSSAAV
jgi:hypothetical protein